MASFEISRPAPFGAVTIHRTLTAADNRRNALIEWNNKRVTRNALSKLSDRELSDIGLTRNDANLI